MRSFIVLSESSSAEPAGATVGDGLPGCGESLACEQEVHAMWQLPVRITLEVKRTRTSWQLIVRVQFIF